MIDDGGATDDAIEIDGESVQNVSNFLCTIIYIQFIDRDRSQSSLATPRKHENYF